MIASMTFFLSGRDTTVALFRLQRGVSSFVASGSGNHGRMQSHVFIQRRIPVGKFPAVCAFGPFLRIDSDQPQRPFPRLTTCTNVRKPFVMALYSLSLWPLFVRGILTNLLPPPAVCTKNEGLCLRTRHVQVLGQGTFTTSQKGVPAVGVGCYVSLFPTPQCCASWRKLVSGEVALRLDLETIDAVYSFVHFYIRLVSEAQKISLA